MSEACYTPLHVLEICFRNALALQLSKSYGSDWPVNNGPPFQSSSLIQISRALEPAENRGETTADLIASLSFGFWVGLIGPRYDSTLWRLSLYRAFGSGRGLARKRVHSRFNALRRFRNRVAHHEPIFHLDLERIHAEIIEAIGWICGETAGWAAEQSRFPDVLHGRVA